MTPPHPAAPTAPTLLAADDSGVVGDGITNVRQPRFVGTAVPNTTVQLVNATGAVLGSAAVGPTGSYTVSPSSLLADGVFAVRVLDVDVAGNISTPSLAFGLTILATPPAAPPAPTLLPSDDSGVIGDRITNVRQPHLTGTVSGGNTVQIVGPGSVVLGTASVNPGGGYSVAFASPLADGTYSVSLDVVDVAGNVSPLSPVLTLTIDGTPPAAPTSPALLAADDSGVIGDGLTNVKQPRLTGTAQPGTSVQLLNAANLVIGTATTTAGGTYTVASNAALTDGTYVLHIQATDLAGNLSPASGTFTLTIRTTLPATPRPAPAPRRRRFGSRGRQHHQRQTAANHRDRRSEHADPVARLLRQRADDHDDRLQRLVHLDHPLPAFRRSPPPSASARKTLPAT